MTLKAATRQITDLTLLPGGSSPDDIYARQIIEHARTLGTDPARYTLPSGWQNRMLVPISLITAGRWQPRSVFAEPETLDLVESIKAHGIINPLIVFVSEHAK